MFTTNCGKAPVLKINRVCLIMFLITELIRLRKFNRYRKHLYDNNSKRCFLLYYIEFYSSKYSLFV